MLPWSQRGVAPSRWFADIPWFNDAATDADRILERGLHCRPVSINDLPDFASWQPTSNMQMQFGLLDGRTYILPSVPGRISVKLLWLLAEPCGPEEASIAWRGLPLLRPERSLASYCLPSPVDLQLCNHPDDSFSVLVAWGLIHFSAYVQPSWKVESLRHIIAFQLGVHPHQVSLKVNGLPLFGGSRCSSLRPAVVVVAEVHGFPTTFDCELCAVRRAAISLCNDCGRTACCAHRQQCLLCHQFICSSCMDRHSCLRLTAPIGGFVMAPCEFC